MIIDGVPYSYKIGSECLPPIGKRNQQELLFMEYLENDLKHTVEKFYSF